MLAIYQFTPSALCWKLGAYLKYLKNRFFFRVMSFLSFNYWLFLLMVRFFSPIICKTDFFKFSWFIYFRTLAVKFRVFFNRRISLIFIYITVRKNYELKFLSHMESFKVLGNKLEVEQLCTLTSKDLFSFNFYPPF